MGAFFGDEGKGAVVNMLADETSAVVRFNGGAQASHTVELQNGKRHAFSSFGSGTFAGSPTFWSKYCPVNPPALLLEHDHLKTIHQERIRLVIDSACPITTHLDILNNQVRISSRYGSCGVGFGDTIARDEGQYKLRMVDLLHEDIFLQKLDGIKTYYARKWEGTGHAHAYSTLDSYYKTFTEACKRLRGLVAENTGIAVAPVNSRSIAWVEGLIGRYTDPDTGNTKWEHPCTSVIFEGAQGILLDQDHGVFPNVTRSSTTSKNAEEIINTFPKTDEDSVTKIYVTRPYITRHGDGWLPGKSVDGVVDHTNVTNPHQGPLRAAEFDIELLAHSMRVDAQYLPEAHLQVWLTCCDHFPERTQRVYDELSLLHEKIGKPVSIITIEGDKYRIFTKK